MKGTRVNAITSMHYWLHIIHVKHYEVLRNLLSYFFSFTDWAAPL